MKKIKKIGLTIYYIFIWLLFIFNLATIFAAVSFILNGDMKQWFIFILVCMLPFLLSYILRNHFKVLARLIVRFLSFIKNIKLTLSATILLGCIILGGFYYVSQVNKQKSIERQQRIDLQAKIEADQAKIKKDNTDAIFSNNLKCQTLLKDLKQRWNNVVGISYNEWQNTCIVKYTKNGETLEGAIEDMQDTK